MSPREFESRRAKRPGPFTFTTYIVRAAPLIQRVQIRHVVGPAVDNEAVPGRRKLHGAVTCVGNDPSFTNPTFVTHTRPIITWRLLSCL
jgi:hypothetical protein